jgi:hypothetical protein
LQPLAIGQMVVYSMVSAGVTTEEVVRKVLRDETPDLLRESLKLLVRELMKVD